MKIRSQAQGFTLIELLVALGIAVITLMTLLSSMQISHQMNRSAQLQNTRDTIANNIRQYAANPAAMYANANGPSPQNDALYSCAIGDNNPCVADSPAPFLFYDVAKNLIGGASPSPVWYSTSGDAIACLGGPSNLCPLQATVDFIPRCPGGNCTPGPQGNVTIEVHYYVASWNDPSVAALEPVTGPVVPISGADIASVGNPPSPTPSPTPSASGPASPSPSPSPSPSNSVSPTPSPSSNWTCVPNPRGCYGGIPPDCNHQIPWTPPSGPCNPGQQCNVDAPNQPSTCVQICTCGGSGASPTPRGACDGSGNYCGAPNDWCCPGLVCLPLALGSSSRGRSPQCCSNPVNGNCP